MAAAIVVELAEVTFADAGRHFVTLLMVGNSPTDQMQERTDVSSTPSTTPTFQKKVFTFPVPPNAEPAQWSLQLSAIAIDPDAAASDAGANSSTKTRVVGASVLALEPVIEPLLQNGAIEQTLTLSPPALPGAASSGTVKLKLRIDPPVAPPALSEPSVAPAPPTTAAPPPAPMEKPPTMARQPSVKQQQSSARRAPSSRTLSASPPLAPAADGPSAPDDARSRELLHQQQLVQQLMDDVAQKTAAAARTGEEVMELRGVNKQLEAELQALRLHVDERERAMEQLAGDATNVENIDMPQLQSRHRMLGAAYRADRRRMEQLTAQVSQLSAALGTQEKLSSSYAELKEAHRGQAVQLQRLQDESKRLHKYKTTCKQQEAIIQKLESLMAAALKDAKRLKTVEPQLTAQTRRAEELATELARAEADAHERERELTMQLQDAQKKLDGRGAEEDELGLGSVGAGGAARAEELAKLLMRAEKSERRAAALEEEMTEMARNHGKEVAGLKMKVAEAEAGANGGFGSAANLALGELPGPALAPSEAPPMPPPRPPSGSTRRATPPAGRLAPVAIGGSASNLLGAEPIAVGT